MIEGGKDVVDAGKEGGMNECKGAARSINTWDNLNIQTPAWACKDCNDLTDKNISSDFHPLLCCCSVVLKFARWKNYLY